MAVATITMLGVAVTWISMAGPSVRADDAIPSAERAKIIEQARPALVQVELFLKHSAEDDLEGAAGGGETATAQLQDRQQEVVARFKQSAHLMGAILSPREVIVVDTGADPRRIARWEVIDATGRHVSAQRTAFFLDTSALVLEPIDADASWKVPAYADVPVNSSSTLTVVAPVRSHLQWILTTMEARPFTTWVAGPDSEKEPAVFWGIGHQTANATESENSPGGEPPASAVSLVFDPAGQLLGVAAADRIYAEHTVPPWRAADLRKAARVSAAEWQRIQDRIREGFSNVMYPVRIEYRRPKGGSQAYPDSELLGWAVADRLLLIPTLIHRRVAAYIEKILVQVDGRDVEAKFLGQCKEIDAFLIQLAEGVAPLSAYSSLERTVSVPQYRMHVAVTPAHRYGQNDLRVNYARPYGYELGYRNRLTALLSPPPPIGSLVCDLDGHPVGLFVRQRRPLEELELYETLSRADPRQLVRQGIQNLQQPSSVEFYPISLLTSVLKNSDTAFDPQVVRRTEADQDRRVWLGVEFNPLTRELAESLGCRKESKDGTVGLMVSQVYAGSPAEEAGLHSGDVLLWLEVPERDHPVLLTPPRFGGNMNFGAGDNSFSGPGGARAPWPARGNYLTNLLATIGENTTIKLKFWRSGAAQELSTTIHQAPPDQDSAAQFKDESLGITVKEVTYEVRTGLRLKPDDAGVVVAKVESGSPAGRARINPFEIVQAADGQPIRSPAEFEAIIKKAQEDKKDQIRLTVVDRGRSRFADLKLGQ